MKNNLTKFLLVIAICVTILQSCSKSDTASSSTDSNQTVTISTQKWTTKNLAVTTYRDGTPIPQVTDPTAWANLTTGAWCYYNNDPANGTVYGKLYNWYAAAGVYDAASLANPSLRKQLAPLGYHVSSDDEWTVLTTYLWDLGVIAGGAMKETGILHWTTPNTSATNTSGFTGLPGGCRIIDVPGEPSFFYYIGSFGQWWTTLDEYAFESDAWSLNYMTGGADYSSDDKRTGYSVRCLKD